MKNIIQWIFDNVFFPFKSTGMVKALLSSFINIIIYLLLLLMVFGIAQGLVIPIDMFENTLGHISLNLVTFHFLLLFMAMLMSWYPNFVFISLFEKVKDVYWEMSKLGLIYYVNLEDVDEDHNQNDLKIQNISENEIKVTESDTESKTRKFFGMFLFVFWSWILVLAFSKSPHVILQGEEIVNENYTSVLIALNLVFTILVLSFNKYFDKKKLKNNPLFLKIPQDIGLYMIGILVLIFIIAIGAIWLFQWSWTSILIEMVLCFFLSLIYIIFRELRTVIFSRNTEEVNKNKVASINFLSFLRMLGIITLTLILAVNIFDDIALKFNPVNIILMNLIALYTMLIIPIKIYLFLSGQNKDKDQNTFNILFLKIKTWHYVSGATLLITLTVFFNFRGNSLHQLITLSDDPKDNIDLSTFYNAYKSNRDSTISPIMYAAYGGGLKANFWNTLILKEIGRDSFKNNVVAMSGVSGGGMGIGLYTLDNYQRISNPNFIEKQKEIGQSNVLSLELSWLFGWDYLRELLPDFLVSGYDRSHRSMDFYSNLFNNDILFSEKKTFRSVYHDLFEHNGYYPNIIVNSTSTKDRYGVVSAINSSSMFPGSIDLLDIHDTDTSSLTLTYLEAISTCNRFPVISPAAKIPNKGHFVDGGYFENSGIMSLISFKKALERYEKDSLEKVFDKPIRLVSVRNDKFNYLQSLLEKDSFDITNFTNENFIKIEESSEILAILGTAGGLEKVPNYLRNLINTYFKQEYELVFIDLPHYITDNDINSYFGGKLDKETHEKVRGIVHTSNKNIIEILKESSKKEVNGYNLRNWGVIDPPTARILSKPVEVYMQDMMKMNSVKKSLEEVFSKNS